MQPAARAPAKATAKPKEPAPRISTGPQTARKDAVASQGKPALQRKNGGDQSNCAEHGPRKSARGGGFFSEAGIARVWRRRGTRRDDAAQAGRSPEMDFGAGFFRFFRAHESDTRAVVHGDGDRARLLASGLAGLDSRRCAVHSARDV